MATTIEVTEIDTTKVYVNQKEVIKDTNGNWVCKEELTSNEQRALREHLTAMGELQ